jgi:hypothetical protein
VSHCELQTVCYDTLHANGDVLKLTWHVSLQKMMEPMKTLRILSRDLVTKDGDWIGE